jgi:hypothetical protein
MYTPNFSAILKLLLGLAALGSLAGSAIVGEGCCARCGRSGECCKICRVVYEEKKVEVTCWGLKCEDFCLPGPGAPGCRNCEEVCDFCDDAGKANGIDSAPKRFVWTEWCPSWARIHTKKKQMKRVVTKTVPTYKWVVEALCEACAAKTASVDVAMEYDALPAPITDAAAPNAFPAADEKFKQYLR